ncbi:hypothetical protein HETIRDRAFT_478374 [Heterobasidion irregulare TC 32-1]|uniref:Cryptic loci regulator 2 N-terminal domain-containing protein n=1 Tax=Heterobasidion irregulare (strain TC 32-1) TaxID=747525 RepID=W4K127_HETIT|nr:uncharacterized protein HETIRDRAFT_478374 [Heterobasidion irregulare TC 32-1]ETW79045.1 hypothetical protein HETIRDRAFT_478374 [Heterobasidion irregulare TC 32-1]
MSARNIAAGHALPPNPEWLDFDRTDGNESQLPTNTQEVVDSDGQVNYMKPVLMGDGPNIHWRTQVASKVAEKMGLPTGKNYVLRNWPAGYAMFDHHKGKKSAPRHDLYLFGSRTRFRSIPEFVPHALWLMTDPFLDRANCECKYCAKQPQRVISENLGFRAPRPSSPSAATATASRRSVREQRPRAPREYQKPYTAVRRIPKPIKPTGPTQVIVHERHNDLQALSEELDMGYRKWFREGEVIWCALDPPIQGPEVTITFWPGIVEESTIKSEIIPRAGSPVTNPTDIDADPDAEADADPDFVMANGTPHSSLIQESERLPPWTVRQRSLYKVKLLGILHHYVVREEDALPYQAYAPSAQLISAMQDVPIERLTLNEEKIAAFNPCPMPAQDTNVDIQSSIAQFEEAAAPYSIAVEIAAGIASFWNPTDEWDYKMTIPPPSPPRPPSGATLHSLLTSATLGGGASGSSVPGTLPASEQMLSSRMMSQAPPASTFTQTRFQGLWWGVERIWVDELVRLKAARRQVAPTGAPNIYPASGPSQETLKEMIEELGQVEGSAAHAQMGAMDRGLFMKIEGIFTVDVPKEDGPGAKKECRVCGMLYELADEKWEETDATPVPEVNGKASSSALPPPQVPPLSLSRLASSESANAALSGPGGASAEYALPKPPHGFKFRPILHPGHEVVISVTLISGRYYPGLIAHPLLRPLARDLQRNAREQYSEETTNLLSLEGLCPGFYNAVDPTRWKASRIAMVKEADRENKAAIWRNWDMKLREKDAKIKGEGVGDLDVEMSNQPLGASATAAGSAAEAGPSTDPGPSTFVSAGAVAVA